MTTPCVIAPEDPMGQDVEVEYNDVDVPVPVEHFIKDYFKFKFHVHKSNYLLLNYDKRLL